MSEDRANRIAEAQRGESRSNDHRPQEAPAEEVITAIGAMLLLSARAGSGPYGRIRYTERKDSRPMQAAHGKGDNSEEDQR